jgi:hypothetical protein
MAGARLHKTYFLARSLIGFMVWLGIPRRSRRSILKWSTRGATPAASRPGYLLAGLGGLVYAYENRKNSI